MWLLRKVAGMATSAAAMGRKVPIPDRPAPGTLHYITKQPMYGPWDEKLQLAMFGMGCFWCSEGLFMRLPGVVSTQVCRCSGLLFTNVVMVGVLDAGFKDVNQG